MKLEVFMRERKKGGEKINGSIYLILIICIYIEVVNVQSMRTCVRNLKEQR